MKENRINLRSKMRGAVVGFAFGEALGYGTEFMTRQQVRTYYPGGLREFSQIIRDAHRSQRKRGEPGHETRMLSTMSETFLKEGKFDIRVLARKFKQWLATVESDYPAIIPVICMTPGWEENPVATAHKVWHERNIREASNEALPRGILAAIISNEKDMAENTRKLVLMTNDDSRCLATTMMIATMISKLLYEDREATYDELAEIGRRIDPRTLHYLEKAYEGDIYSLKVDDEETQCWTRKSTAAALWGLRHGQDAADSIFKVVDLGGDSDNNAAIVGSMVGIKYGYEALPEEKEKLIGLDGLIDVADKLCDLIKEREKIADDE